MKRLTGILITVLCCALVFSFASAEVTADTTEANGKVTAAKLPEKKNGFYLIRWKATSGEGINHFVCTIGDDWTWEGYKACMEKAGFYDEFEGF